MSAEKAPKPRIGIPYRTRKEELSNKRDAYDKYLAAVEAAGAEPVEISLGLPTPELMKIAQDLDAIVLPGSPADVEPSRFHAARH
ncbi:MAG: gamma-glutamyl-gamma-aminobutyrate hydrolase family protein, partial [Candidatus Acidiferrales bacterium]